jgi:polysaccharide biosynthesis protein PslH
MTARPNLLFLAQSLPFPPHSGVQSRTFHLLRQLQREFEVTLLPFARRQHHGDKEARVAAAAALAQLVSRVGEPVPIPAEYSRLRRLRDHALSLASGRPYTFYEYEAGAYPRQLDALLSSVAFDLVHLDSLDLVRFADRLPTVPVTCTHPDIESELLERKASQVRFPLLRHYIRYQSRLVRRVERTACPRFTLNLMMSERDAAVLQELAPGARTLVVPNGVDTQHFAPPPAEAVVRGRIVFLGPTYIFANRDAVEFFLGAVWPRVRERCPDATFELVGRNSAAEAARYRQLGAVLPAGYVPDVRPHLQRAACTVVPIRIGGGTRLKILEAWATGVPVVSTRVGCEGLEASDGHNLLIRDDPREFAEAVTQILLDEALRRRLAEAGRRTVEQHYSWERIAGVLRTAYRGLVEASRRSGGRFFQESHQAGAERPTQR